MSVEVWTVKGSAGAMAKSFRDLAVWQKGIRLTVVVYRLTKTFPREEIYGLTSQMRRAAVSIPSNIAEGAGRLNTPEYKQFLGIARGSSFELPTQLTIARELEFGKSEDLAEAEVLCNEIGRMLFALISKIGEESTPGESLASAYATSAANSTLHTSTLHTD